MGTRSMLAIAPRLMYYTDVHVIILSDGRSGQLQCGPPVPTVEDWVYDYDRHTVAHIL